MFIHALDQRSEQWYATREACLVTASDAGAWIYENTEKARKARTKRIHQYLTRDAYCGGDEYLQKIAERERLILDRDLAIQRGNHFEDDAADDFEKHTGLETEKVGIITTDDGLFGASADRLIVGEEAGLELKTPLPETHSAYLVENQLHGGMPEEYLHQVHFSMAVSEFPLWWFSSYPTPYYDRAGRWVRAPRLVVRVKANALTEKIRKGMDSMREELERTRKILGGLAVRQAKGEDTSVHEAK